MYGIMHIMFRGSMALQPEAISWESLRSDEVAELPTRLREMIGADSTTEGSWVVLHSSDESLQIVVDHIERLYRISSHATRQETEREPLARALDWMVAFGMGVNAQLEVDNFELRSQYIRETPMLTAAQIHEVSGLKSKNTSEPASRWKLEGKTFALRISGRDLYPEFQFVDGSPRPVMKSILEALPRTMSAWQKAIWFASGNGWLDGAEPQHCLEKGDSVVAAARQLADPARG